MTVLQQNSVDIQKSFHKSYESLSSRDSGERQIHLN